MDNTNDNILEKNLFKDDIEIKVLDAKEVFLTNNTNSRIQFHPFIYFYFMVEGSGTFFIESDAIKIQKNDLIIINSNIGHNIYVDENEFACRALCFGVESIGLTSVNKKDGDNEAKKTNNDPIGDEKSDKIQIYNYFHIPVKQNAKNIYEMFTNIVKEFTGNNLYSKTLADTIASYFVINFLRHFEGKIEVVHDINVNRQVDYIKSFLDTNYAQDIKLEELSSMAYMNKFHLIAEFKQAYRVTPIEYLILKRIEVSKGLLISTNHSMETIGNIVGFNSQSYFNQVFRKKVGLTPSQFRKKHRL